MGRQTDNSDVLKKEVKLLENPLSCLSANNHVRHLAVGGRNVFKIFNCQKQEFEEVTNLRSGISPNNQFLGVNDVNWCKTDEKTLVSASNHGAVVIWDINNNGQAVQEYIMKEQQRTINSLEFYVDSPNMLLAASQDGSCKCIDLRKRDIPVIYGPSIESPAREVQFDPRNSNQFAVVFENGSCQIWDIRNTTHFERHWVAHIGTSVCLNWHPVENWLVTGGRDKTAAVWDFSRKTSSFPVTSSSAPLPNKMAYKYSAETVASVGKVKWRPNHKYQVLTTPMLTETYASVWDVRRPFVPEVFFVEHKDTIGGVVWKDENIFYTCGRDHKLCRFVYSDHSHLKDSLNPVSLSLNIYGHILHSAHDKLVGRARDDVIIDDDVVAGEEDGGRWTDTSALTIYIKNNDDDDDDDHILTQNSVTVEFQSTKEGPINQQLTMEPFIKMAQEYKLANEPFTKLCEHNANVAKQAGKHHISTTWSMIGLMFESLDTVAKEAVTKKISRVENKVVAFPEHIRADEKKVSMKMSAASNNDSDSEYDGSIIKNNPYYDILEFSTDPDIFDHEIDDESSGKDDRQESYQMEQDLNQHFESDVQLVNIGDLASYSTPLDDSESPGTECSITIKSKSRRVEVEEVIKYEIINTEPYVNSIKMFDYTDSVVSMLHSFAEQNDVQSAVSMALVLGNKVKDRIDTNTFAFWLTSYIDQLNRFELYITSTDVQNVYQPDEPQMSTVIKIFCSQCQRNMRHGWLCRKCPKHDRNNFLHVCSICHLPVKSLFIWCQGCAHGGHIKHISDWFVKHRECPSGCGHLCEYA